MLRFRSLLGILALVLMPVPALAQSSAQPVLPGLLTTSGCSYGLSVCYLPYSVTNPLPVTSAGGSAVASTFVSSAALVANQIITATASKRLVSFQVSADSTLSAGAWWVMVYDATSAPVDGSVTPAKCYAMPSGSTLLSAGFPPNSPSFSTGITIGVSTTGCFTKTASTHAYISGDFTS